MKGKAILAMMVTVGLLGGVSVMAQQGTEGRKSWGPGGRGDRMADYLGLSADQKTSIEALRKEERTQTEPLRAEGKELHQTLRTLMAQDNPDPAALGAAMLAVKQHGAKMKTSHDAFEAKIKASLTPEQKQKFEAFQAARQTGHGRGGRHGFAGHQPTPPDGGESPEPF